MGKFCPAKKKEFSKRLISIIRILSLLPSIRYVVFLFVFFFLFVNEGGGISGWPLKPTPPH